MGGELPYRFGSAKSRREGAVQAISRDRFIVRFLFQLYPNTSSRSWHLMCKLAEYCTRYDHRGRLLAGKSQRSGNRRYLAPETLRAWLLGSREYRRACQQTHQSPVPLRSIPPEIPLSGVTTPTRTRSHQKRVLRMAIAPPSLQLLPIQGDWWIATSHRHLADLSATSEQLYLTRKTSPNCVPCAKRCPQTKPSELVGNG